VYQARYHLLLLRSISILQTAINRGTARRAHHCHYAQRLFTAAPFTGVHRTAPPFAAFTCDKHYLAPPPLRLPISVRTRHIRRRRTRCENAAFDITAAAQAVGILISTRRKSSWTTSTTGERLLLVRRDLCDISIFDKPVGIYRGTKAQNLDERSQQRRTRTAGKEARACATTRGGGGANRLVSTEGRRNGGEEGRPGQEKNKNEILHSNVLLMYLQW